MSELAVLAALALDAQEEDLGQSLTTWPDCLQNMQRWLSKWHFRSSGASLPFLPSFDEMSDFIADLSSDLLWSLEGLLLEVWAELWVWVKEDVGWEGVGLEGTFVEVVGFACVTSIQFRPLTPTS